MILQNEWLSKMECIYKFCNAVFCFLIPSPCTVRVMKIIYYIKWLCYDFFPYNTELCTV